MSNGTGKESEEKGKGEERIEYPNIVERFREVFNKLGIKKADAYVDHCAKGDLENLEEVETKLYELGLHPSLRNQVINFWAAEIKQPVPDKLKKELAQERGAKIRRQKAEKETEEAVWTVAVDDSGVPRMRMIKDESEPGVTFERAQKALKEIAKEGQEPVVIYNEGLKKHMPNFKSPFVKQNPAAAWATANLMDKAMLAGETADPMDVFIDQQARIIQMKEILGVTTEAKEKTTVGEIINGIKELQGMASQGKGISLPEWMTNPVEFINTVQAITKTEGKGGGPDWLTDPVKFIETVRAVAGEGRGDDAIKTELTEMRKALDDMREQRYQDTIGSLAGQIKSMQETHTKEMREVLDKVEEARRPVTGRTEMDILDKAIEKGTDTIREAGRDIRGALQEILGGHRLPPAKTPTEKQDRKERYSKALQADEEIEELGRRLFRS